MKNLIWRYQIVKWVGCSAFIAAISGSKGKLSLDLAALFLACEVNQHLVPIIFKRPKPVLGILAWLGCAAVLAGLYYGADLFLFLHSPRTMSRTGDIVSCTVLFMVTGFLMEYWSPTDRQKSAAKQG